MMGACGIAILEEDECKRERKRWSVPLLLLFAKGLAHFVDDLLFALELEWEFPLGVGHLRQLLQALSGQDTNHMVEINHGRAILKL